MPYFAVILNGEGISVPLVDSDEHMVGFYTTRWVKAQNLEQAREAAAHLVRDDWTLGEFASVNRGNSPQILVDSIWEISRWQYWLRRKPSGHTFYPKE